MSTHSVMVTAESQGLCFIGKVRLPDFLQQQLKPKEGNVIELQESLEQFQNKMEYKENYTELELKELSAPYSLAPEMGVLKGKHTGAHYFTVGQRKGLGIGGTPLPLFVVETDTKNNVVYMGQGHEFPGLLKRGLFIPKEEVHWIREDLKMELGEYRTYSLRIRYRQNLKEGKIYATADGIYMVFKELAWGITPGQFATWYDGDKLIGSGVIS